MYHLIISVSMRHYKIYVGRDDVKPIYNSFKFRYKTYDIVCVKMCYKICYKVKGEMMEIHPAVQGGAEQGSARVGRGQGTSLPNHVFQEVLDAAGSRTRFSSHAKTRIEQRGVRLTADDLTRLDDAIDRMAAKGVRDALVYLSRGLAMVVSVKNRTVITALDEASAKENIFTNIDSAAIL